MSQSVLFVCLGNICRSPAAEGVARRLNEQFNLFAHIDSAGTSAAHIGEAPHHTMQDVAIQHGYSLSGQFSRQVERSDFDKFDYIVAMDYYNLMDLQSIQPAQPDQKAPHCHLVSLLEFDPRSGRDVPDPYYGGLEGFVNCFHIVESGMRAFFKHVEGQTK